MSTQPTWVVPFLASLAIRGVRAQAAADVGIARSTASRHEHANPEFAGLVEEAIAEFNDWAEGEAIRRAMHGVEEVVLYQGQPTYVYERTADGQVVMDIAEVQVKQADGEMKTITERRPRVKLDSNGNPAVLTVNKRSDALMALVLKGRRVYTDRQELTGAEGSPLNDVDPTSLAARAAALLEAARARRDGTAQPEPIDNDDIV